ncbi:hypothetical protein XACa0007 (plasmid) [Xanthomonas citri pv. citri str. 306]|uniref:Uncharacterized protein n=1 Tax=Xanthomonas axonopodis pv. citri (strain 306) TaxID=190486 RepID=A0AAI7ZJC3_XANAC|nr:hypothetical protein XACa0007 [Xanthomonas citri pv. citri str. 306]
MCGIVTHNSTHKDVGIDCDLHCLPAHPCAAASLISSMVATFCVLPASRPTKLAIVPAGRAALSTPRPSGSKSSSILSPGLMPRCCSTSFRNVTCPRAVTVNVVMVMCLAISWVDVIVMQKSLTCAVRQTIVCRSCRTLS